MSLISDVCPTCGRRKTRSVPQNSRYFALLSKASNSMGYSKDILHEWFKQLFLPCKVINIGGTEKIIPYQTHNLLMHKNHDDPDSPNWDDYSMSVEVWLSERGIYLDE